MAEKSEYSPQFAQRLACLSQLAQPVGISTSPLFQLLLITITVNPTQQIE
jgi:hypothetical protein